MPLPESSQRIELHLRRIEMRGYRRDDGLYEIDGRVTDSKAQSIMLDERGPLAAGEFIHDMWVRLVVDENLVVRDIVAVTDSSPYAVCREATAAMRVIVGEQIKAGWTMRVKALLGGAKGCTHLMELLIPLATTAYQTLAPLRMKRPDALDSRGRPLKMDSCYAYASHRDIARRRWPDFAEGAT